MKSIKLSRAIAAVMASFGSLAFSSGCGLLTNEEGTPAQTTPTACADAGETPLWTCSNSLRFTQVPEGFSAQRCLVNDLHLTCKPNCDGPAVICGPSSDCGDIGKRSLQGCGYYERQVPCGLTSGQQAGTEAIPAGDCVKYCDPVDSAASPACLVRTGKDGIRLLSCSSICVGRRPRGLCEQIARTSSHVANYYAKMAELEAAAVFAFAQLKRELRSHGAPSEILGRIDQAIREEKSHAKATGELARKFGTEPIVPKVTSPFALRTLFDVALDNAVEGCVKETFGALVGRYQAQHATDPDVRRAMISIADDELRHAQLSWDIHVWALSKLSTEAQETIRQSMDAAMTELIDHAEHYDKTLQDVAGLPNRSVLSEMARGLFSHEEIASAS